MPTDIPVLPRPTLHTWRSIVKILCHDGILCLRADFTDLPGLKSFSVNVALYIPSTSLGYLRLYDDGNMPIRNQVTHQSRGVLLGIIDQAAHAGCKLTHFTDTTAIIQGNLDKFLNLLISLPT